MKVRWWPHSTDSRIASVRLRCWQVMEALKLRGVDVGLLQSTEAPPAILIMLKRYDALSLRRARRCQQSGTRLILDICDNHFYCESPAVKWTQRAADLRSAVRCVDAVTVSTDALADAVRNECGNVPALYVVGDAVEGNHKHGLAERWTHPLHETRFLRFQRRIRNYRRSRKLLLLWFGNHGSEYAAGGMQDLLLVKARLGELARSMPAHLTVISNDRRKFALVASKLEIPSTYLPWYHTTFSRAVAMHDIAILPIGLNPFTYCKSNNRLATAVMHGLPVIADRIPSYQEFEGVAMTCDWTSGLAALASDVELRRSFVENGRSLIASRWSLAEIASQWHHILRDVGGR